VRCGPAAASSDAPKHSTPTTTPTAKRRVSDRDHRSARSRDTVATASRTSSNTGSGSGAWAGTSWSTSPSRRPSAATVFAVSNGAPPSRWRTQPLFPSGRWSPVSERMVGSSSVSVVSTGSAMSTRPRLLVIVTRESAVVAVVACPMEACSRCPDARRDTASAGRTVGAGVYKIADVDTSASFRVMSRSFDHLVVAGTPVPPATASDHPAGDGGQHSSRRADRGHEQRPCRRR